MGMGGVGTDWLLWCLVGPVGVDGGLEVGDLIPREASCSDGESRSLGRREFWRGDGHIVVVVVDVLFAVMNMVSGWVEVGFSLLAG